MANEPSSIRDGDLVWRRSEPRWRGTVMLRSESFFQQLFDAGHYFDRDGAVTMDVTFLNGGRQFPGRLHFIDGLCVRATMNGGGDWGYPDNSPLHNVDFILHLDDFEPPYPINIISGRVFTDFDAE